MSNLISLKLNGLEFTAQESKDIVKAMIDDIVNGEVQALETLAKMNLLKKTFDAVYKNKQVQEAAIDQIPMYQGQTVSGYNVYLSSRKKWEYDDSEIEILEAQKKAIDQKIKDRQAMLQNLTKEQADIETGEIIKPATYKSTQIINFK